MYDACMCDYLNIYLFQQTLKLVCCGQCCGRRLRWKLWKNNEYCKGKYV